MMESPEDQIKRLRMRSWRRGIKEMDLILGGFADRHLAALSSEDRALYDALLSENDQDLYAWVTGQATCPEPHAAILGRIKDSIEPPPNSSSRST
ncbi:MAG: succinate dehydrogenase assembly factor 2 [Pseudomonadota bacterium]